MNINLFAPSENIIFEISDHVKQKLAGSFEYLLSLILEILSTTSIDQCKSQLSKIRNSKHNISGYLHVIHNKLVSAIDMKDESQVKQLIEEFIDSDFSVKSLQMIRFDAESMGELRFDLYKSIFTEDDTYQISFSSPANESYNGVYQKLNAGIQILKENSPFIYVEFDNLVGEIILFENDTTNIVSSGTSLKSYGTIFIASNLSDSITFYIEALVHESAHLYLFGLAIEDAIVLNPDSERYSAPLRKDKRTMSGIFHASFVIARILYAFNDILKNNKIDRDIRSSINDRIAFLLPKFYSSFETITRYARLTDLGQSLINNAENFVKSIDKNGY